MKTAISCSNSQVSTETQVTASPTPLSHLSDSALLQRKKSNLPAEQQRKFLRQARQKVPPLPKHNCCNFISQQNEEICSSFWNQWQMSISQKLGPNKRWAISTALFMEVTANKEENVLLF